MLQSTSSWSLEDIQNNSSSSELKLRVAEQAFEVVVGWDMTQGRVNMQTRVCAAEAASCKFAHMDKQV